MKTYQFAIITLLLVIGIGYQVFTPNTSQKLGIAANVINYSSATNTSVACAASTSTLISAIDSARTSFNLSNNATGTVYICKVALGCTTGTGFTLPTLTRFEQTDGYIGAYSCISLTATSSVGVSYSD